MKNQWTTAISKYLSEYTINLSTNENHNYGPYNNMKSENNKNKKNYEK